MTNYAEGTKVEVKVGKNTVQAEIVAIVGETSIQVKNLRTGKIFLTSTARAKKVEEALTVEEPQQEPIVEETATTEEAPTPSEETEAKEEPKAEPTEKKARKQGGKSLFQIGVETLELSDTELSVTEILRIAEQEGIFNPSDWGSTPEQTLYSAFVRETKTKVYPKVVKSEARGKWALNIG